MGTTDVMDAIQEIVMAKGPQLPAEPRWYEFDQNNSGGFFKGPAHKVWVQALSVEEACTVAEDHGLYFGGAGDCSCCGDRWSSPWRDDGKESPFAVSKEKGNIRQNVLCDKLPQDNEDGSRDYTRFITTPTTTPWTRDRISERGLRGSTLMLIARNGAVAYCKSVQFFDNTWGY